MAENKKISQFTQATSVQDNDKIPLVRGNLNLYGNWSAFRNNLNPIVLQISSTYIMTNGQDVDIIEIDSSSSAVTLTLPNASSYSSKKISIKVTSHTNLVTIAGTIDGETNLYMNNDDNSVDIYSNGTAWKKLGFKISYDTGWKLNLLNGGVSADWTSVHLGSDNTQDSNVDHNLNCGIERLFIKFLISSDGTQGNAVQLAPTQYSDGNGSSPFGETIFGIDDNSFKLQTATNGIGYISDSGGFATALTNQAYYYRIIVVRLF